MSGDVRLFWSVSSEMHSVRFAAVVAPANLAPLTALATATYLTTVFTAIAPSANAELASIGPFSIQRKCRASPPAAPSALTAIVTALPAFRT